MNSNNLQYAFQVEYMTTAIRAAEHDQPMDDANREFIRKTAGIDPQGIFSFGRAFGSRIREKTKEDAGLHAFIMKVRYPGLLIGTGYMHETGDATGGIQTGFSFDDITGSPCYPGSSLKGILRAPFAAARSGKAGELEEWLDYFRGIFGKPELSEEDIEDFLQESFTGEPAGSKAGEAGLPMQARDIFYDVFPVGYAPDTVPPALLGLDNITPHIDQATGLPAPFKDPVPLTLLRIMPGTCFQFLMKLHDAHKRDGSILVTAEEKAAAYQAILEDFGIGAKTRVGYGGLEPVKKPEQIVLGPQEKPKPAQKPKNSAKPVGKKKKK